jgi:hypothetical protein
MAKRLKDKPRRWRSAFTPLQHHQLSVTGSFYYHCDWHASHYVKVVLDQIFGESNFQNEIVWKRTRAK